MGDLQTAQFSITGSAIPTAATWMRRIEPPCVTTTTRSSGMRRRDPEHRSEHALASGRLVRLAHVLDPVALGPG